MPRTRDEKTRLGDGPDEAGGRGLVRALVHQLKVEVEVGDWVPAEIRANDPARRGFRQSALERLRGAASEAVDVAAAALVAPQQLADRAFKVRIELRREVVLEYAGDRPCGRRRPLVGQRVEV